MDGLPTSIADMESTAPYDTPLKTRAYEAVLRKLQIELLKLQLSVREGGRRVVILFEGRDAAGKGGSIKRFTENLNPRGGSVVALTEPKRRARLEAIRAVLHALDDDHKDTDVAHAPDPRVVRPASALEVPADAGALATGGRAAAT
jgi:polyphosphate kinase 2 (PPK2 family)